MLWIFREQNYDRPSITCSKKTNLIFLERTTTWFTPFWTCRRTWSVRSWWSGSKDFKRVCQCASEEPFWDLSGVFFISSDSCYFNLAMYSGITLERKFFTEKKMCFEDDPTVLKLVILFNFSTFCRSSCVLF